MLVIISMITILTRCWLLFIDALVYQSSKGNSMATETKELCLGQKKTMKEFVGGLFECDYKFE